MVDIGAGTSDIAITKDGKIIAYAMTSIAGDEITEALSKKYLLDFNTGEELKIKLNSRNKHRFTDIVGIEHNLTTEEIVDSIYDIINKISRKISEKIIEFNEKAPDAVFLIGGSSQMPRLKECLAKNLGLPKERVSIKDTSFIQNVEGIDQNINGPDIVTPIGIAMEGATKKYRNFLQIEFNGEEIKIFNTENVKVSYVLVLTGYKPRNLIPKSGDDFIYFLNDKKKIIKGKVGNPAKIYVNNKIGSLSTPLNDGDSLKIVEGSKGEKIIPYLYDCIPKEKVVNFNNRKYDLIKDIKINGIQVKDNPMLKEGDRIEFLEIKTIADFLKYIDKDIPVDRILINGKKADKNTILNANDEIIIIPNRTIKLNINGEERIIEYNKKDFIFVDIFDHIDFDLTKSKGKLVLKVNGRDAEYMEPLKDGDVIQVFWNR